MIRKQGKDHTVFNIRLLDTVTIFHPDPTLLLHMCANKLVFALSSVIVHFAQYGFRI